MVRRSDEECSATPQLGSFCDAIMGPIEAETGDHFNEIA